jgi:hypothetical protein
MGIEGPVYIGMSSSKSLVEWYKGYEAFQENMGEAGRKSQERRHKLLRRHETKHLWFCPGLSYILEEK